MVSQPNNRFKRSRLNYESHVQVRLDANGGAGIHVPGRVLGRVSGRAGQRVWIIQRGRNSGLAVDQSGSGARHTLRRRWGWCASGTVGVQFDATCHRQTARQQHERARFCGPFLARRWATNPCGTSWIPLLANVRNHLHVSHTRRRGIGGALVAAFARALPRDHEPVLHAIWRRVRWWRRMGGDPGATQAIKHKIAQETPCSFSRYTVEHRSNPFLDIWSDLAGSNSFWAGSSFLFPLSHTVFLRRKSTVQHGVSLNPRLFIGPEGLFQTLMLSR